MTFALPIKLSLSQLEVFYFYSSNSLPDPTAGSEQAAMLVLDASWG